MALYIERPSGIDLSDDRVTLDVKDENGLRTATIVVVVREDVASRMDIIRVNVGTVPSDEHVAVETRVVQGG